MGVDPVRLAASSLQPFHALLPARGGFAQPPGLTRFVDALRHVTAPQAGRGRPGRGRAGLGAWRALAAAIPDPKLFRFSSNRADALALSDGYPSAPPASDATIRTIASLTCR